MELLNRHFGRCGAIAASGVFNIMGSIANFNDHIWQYSLISRLLCAIGQTLLACTLSIYGAEISTARSRGRAVSWWQL